MKETLKYMKEMDISKEDRRIFIQDSYSFIGNLIGFPYILKEKTKEIFESYEKTPLITESAKSALEKSLDNKASEIIMNYQNDEYYDENMF